MSWKDELDQKYNNDFGKSASDRGFSFDDDKYLQSMQSYAANQNNYQRKGDNHQRQTNPKVVFYLIFFVMTILSAIIFILYLNNAQQIHPETISKENKRAVAEPTPESVIIFEQDKNTDNHGNNANADNNANPTVPDQGRNVDKYFEYDCTKSFISSDSGYGSPTSPGACPTGIARMELTDHKANIYDAIEDCRNRGMRLPTNHELSAAGKYATELGLQSGNYWSNNKFKDDYAHNCFMPRGNCGHFYSPPSKSVVQWYRCVVPEDSYQPNEINNNIMDSGTKKQIQTSYKMKESSTFSTSYENRTAIETILKKKNNDIKNCYNRAMNEHGEKIVGHLTISVEVGKNGSVLNVESIEDEIGYEVFACIKQRIMNWQFGTLDSPTIFKKSWAFK